MRLFSGTSLSSGASPAAVSSQHPPAAPQTSSSDHDNSTSPLIISFYTFVSAIATSPDSSQPHQQSQQKQSQLSLSGPLVLRSVKDTCRGSILSLGCVVLAIGSYYLHQQRLDKSLSVPPASVSSSSFPLPSDDTSLFSSMSVALLDNLISTSPNTSSPPLISQSVQEWLSNHAITSCDDVDQHLLSGSLSTVTANQSSSSTTTSSPSTLDTDVRSIDLPADIGTVACLTHDDAGNRVFVFSDRGLFAIAVKGSNQGEIVSSNQGFNNIITKLMPNRRDSAFPSLDHPSTIVYVDGTTRRQNASPEDSAPSMPSVSTTMTDTDSWQHLYLLVCLESEQPAYFLIKIDACTLQVLDTRLCGWASVTWKGNHEDSKTGTGDTNDKESEATDALGKRARQAVKSPDDPRDDITPQLESFSSYASDLETKRESPIITLFFNSLIESGSICQGLLFSPSLDKHLLACHSLRPSGLVKLPNNVPLFGMNLIATKPSYGFDLEPESHVIVIDPYSSYTVVDYIHLRHPTTPSPSGSMQPKSASPSAGIPSLYIVGDPFNMTTDYDDIEQADRPMATVEPVKDLPEDKIIKQLEVNDECALILYDDGKFAVQVLSRLFTNQLSLYYLLILFLLPPYWAA